MNKKIVKIGIAIVVVLIVVCGVALALNYGISSNMGKLEIEASSQNETKGCDEDTTDRTIDKVSMTIKEGTLTKTGATVIIKDENKNPYCYGAWFRIDKNENGEWKELDALAIVDWKEIAYQVKEDGTLEMEEIWKNIYGELEKGQYRLVKSIYEDVYKYFYVEFNID
jgi:hypothetical protein